MNFYWNQFKNQHRFLLHDSYHWAKLSNYSNTSRFVSYLVFILRWQWWRNELTFSNFLHIYTEKGRQKEKEGDAYKMILCQLNRYAFGKATTNRISLYRSFFYIFIAIACVYTIAVFVYSLAHPFVLPFIFQLYVLLPLVNHYVSRHKFDEQNTNQN